MSPPLDSTSAEVFESKYRAQSDPWHFADSNYEQSRYQTTINSLRRERYETVYEPGCSIGELTARLCERCDTVIASDLSYTAVTRALKRCAAYSNASIFTTVNPVYVPNETLDLIVFSELGYYFDTNVLGTYACNLARALQPGGEFIAVHWLGDSPDHRLHGNDVHEQLLNSLPLSWVAGSEHPGFRVDTWIRHV